MDEVDAVDSFPMHGFSVSFLVAAMGRLGED